MKNKLYVFSAVILCLSIILCACGKEPENIPTTAPSTEESVVTTVQSSDKKETVTYTDVSGYHVISVVEPTTQEKTLPPVPSHATEPTYKTETLYNTENSNAQTAPVKPENPTAPKATAPTAAPTVKPTESITVPEIAEGLVLRFKSGTVDRGYSASIAVEGTAGKEYTIEVFRSNGETLNSDKLSPKTAGADGVVHWSIPTGNLTSGNTKVIIREKGSDKYIQTSISVA